MLNQAISLTGNHSVGVLILHSLYETPSQMSDLAKKLNAAGYTVHVPVLTGHDQSFEDIIETDIYQWDKDVKNAYQSLKDNHLKVVVIGMSIGGSLAVKLAENSDLFGLITVNAPIIGFPIAYDIRDFAQKKNDVTVKDYEQHRRKYFDFVIELGQTANLKKITAPLFVVQGKKDQNRYKTSSDMLMTLSTSTIKERKDYENSEHLALLGPDKSQIEKDILAFIKRLERRNNNANS
ncbi:MAG: alpha/beta hydrolase [Candidatus Izimaplasma sp.]|nr:alpha/beta hydrolase [Candidatus Izimaplasma bacterium]